MTRFTCDWSEHHVRQNLQGIVFEMCCPLWGGGTSKNFTTIEAFVPFKPALKRKLGRNFP